MAVGKVSRTAVSCKVSSEVLEGEMRDCGKAPTFCVWGAAGGAGPGGSVGCPTRSGRKTSVSDHPKVPR